MLQTLHGTDGCNTIIIPLLNRVKERMSIQPLNDVLKKHMLFIYLSAVIYNRSAAI
jgi:hypothetical protein